MGSLLYQPLTDFYTSSLQSLWSDEDVIRYTNIKTPCTLEETQERIQALQQFDVFVVSKNDTVIGLIGCPCIDRSQRHFGLFYQFQKSAWGQGNATCAAEWILDFMAQKYQTVTLFADVLVDNIASEKILQKLGFQYTFQEDYIRNGIRTKIHHYIKEK